MRQIKLCEYLFDDIEFIESRSCKLVEVQLGRGIVINAQTTDDELAAISANLLVDARLRDYDLIDGIEVLHDFREYCK